MSNDLLIAGPQRFLPVLSVEDAVQRRSAIIEFVQKVMKPDVDFGVLPGTQKPTLLKSGAEKLCTLFGLTSRFQILRMVEDWTGAQHDGEPFFYYLYHCQLWRDDLLIAEGDGSCNSFEQKYRYRDAQRLCPECGRAAIVKGKAEFGGGWLCFVKRGGCGAKFPDGDETVESQAIGRVRNPDIADVVNTVQKMGQKRALVAATLLAVNASEFFTQDIEDAPHVKGVVPVAETAAEEIEAAAAKRGGADAPPEAPDLRSAAGIRAAFARRAGEQFGLEGRADLAELAVHLLGRKPDRWTAQVWQEIMDRPPALWQRAVEMRKRACAAQESSRLDRTMAEQSPRQKRIEET
jgi:hypothetical protein